MERTRYKVTTPRGRVRKQKLTKDEALALRIEGSQVEEIERFEVVPNREMLRAQGMRSSSGLRPYPPRHRTGKGNGELFFEQHWRGGGRTSGKRQTYRFPIEMLEEKK